MGTNVNYGRFLEFGTVKMAPRPWLRPSLDMNRDTIVKEIRQAGSEMEGGVHGG